MSPNSEKLFIILILFFGLAVAFLLASNAQVATFEDNAPVREIPSELRSANLNFSIFDSILFKQLKVFGLIPVIPGQTGREDPFRP